MKYLLIIAVFGLASCATQEKSNKISFVCVESTVNTESNYTELIDVESFKADGFEVKNAEKVIINMTDKVVVVYNCEEFTTQAKVKILSLKPSGVIRYHLGDNYVYIE